MPRRLPDGDTLRALAQQPPNNGGALGLEAQIEQVLAEWASSADHSDQTRARMGETVLRFARRLRASEVRALDAVSAGDARAFVLSATRYGEQPEVATQHARRTALRSLFRTARALGLADGDPTLDLRIPPRGTQVARPLTDGEVTLCRAAARTARGASSSVRATAWALGEATAVSSEITAARIADLDDRQRPRAVRLQGTARHDPRTVSLTEWGCLVIQRRVADLLADGAGAQTLLAYGGAAPPGGAKAQAAVCNALRDVLNAAGLLDEPDVRPASLRNWAGRCAFDAGQPLETVARFMGLRSLDATAEDIALDWRREEVSAG
jgi:integrase/recombinase XerC